ncbi:MAG: peptidoglycan-binding domain-containing protein, partial [Tumebacillaceae bacterium]
MLQEDLRVLGYFTYPTDTGYFGDITLSAVKAFQKDHNLTENGMVGMTTGPVIQAEAAKKRP